METFFSIPKKKKIPSRQIKNGKFFFSVAVKKQSTLATPRQLQGAVSLRASRLQGPLADWLLPETVEPGPGRSNSPKFTWLTS